MGDTIVYVHPLGARSIPSQYRVIDVTGRYLLPGLIDTHVHLATDPSGRDALDHAVARLEHALKGGVTTVRDMGGDARQLGFLARAALVGDIVSPEIFYSAIIAGADFMADPRVMASTRGYAAGAAPWGRAVDDTTDWHDVAVAAWGAGASGVKFYADAGATVVEPMTHAAHQQGLQVWAHATVFPARPSDLVAAGVDVLSHASYLIWEAVDSLPDYRLRARGDFANIPPDHPAIVQLLLAMATRQTTLDPTLFVFRDRTEDALPWSQAVTRLAWSSDVQLSAGTDNLGEDGPNLHDELALMVEAGIPIMDVLVAATRNGARAIGIEDTHGTIEAGRVANLLVLEANPLDDIANTRRIAMVVKRGVVVDR
jgi:imidazolonepropionase-like amidohydrolase